MPRDKTNKRVPALCVLGVIVSAVSVGANWAFGNEIEIAISIGLGVFFTTIALDW